jgi:hypothetical protein
MDFVFARGRTGDELGQVVATLESQGFVPRGSEFELYEYWSVEEARRTRRRRWVAYRAMVRLAPRHDRPS